MHARRNHTHKRWRPAGEIRVGPHVLRPAASRSDGAAVRQVRRLLGMIFQDFQLFGHLTVLGNVIDVLGVLEDLKRDGLTLVVVTHELGFARRAADRIVVLDEGKVIEEGPLEHVFDDPQMPRTRRFLSRVLA